MTENDNLAEFLQGMPFYVCWLQLYVKLDARKLPIWMRHTAIIATQQWVQLGARFKVWKYLCLHTAHRHALIIQNSVHTFPKVKHRVWVKRWGAFIWELLSMSINYIGSETWQLQRLYITSESLKRYICLALTYGHTFQLPYITNVL